VHLPTCRRPNPLLRQAATSRIFLLQNLFSRRCKPDGYAVLTSLGLLSQLSLDSNRHLPGCLPQLTTLRELHMDEACLAWELDEIQEALDAALLHLTQARQGLASKAAVGVHAAVPA